MGRGVGVNCSASVLVMVVLTGGWLDGIGRGTLAIVATAAFHWPTAASCVLSIKMCNTVLQRGNNKSLNTSHPKII